MILTVNLGNTHITIGGYEHDDLKFCGRLHTDPAATVDEYGLRLLNLLSLHGASPEQIEGGILGSVVPALTGRVLAALQMLCPVRILTVGPGLKSGIRLRLDNPAQLGAELLCGAVAALAEGSGPLVVISADTAISLMAVNGKQELVGGVILPGPQLSLAALVQNTAQLPQIDLSAPAPASVLARIPPPACRTALSSALPGCWTGWLTISVPSLALRRSSTPPAICPRPSETPAARPSSTVRRSSRTACTASGCGIAAKVLFAFCKRLCYTILY